MKILYSILSHTAHILWCFVMVWDSSDEETKKIIYWAFKKKSILEISENASTSDHLVRSRNLTEISRLGFALNTLYYKSKVVKFSVQRQRDRCAWARARAQTGMVVPIQVICARKMQSREVGMGNGSIPQWPQWRWSIVFEGLPALSASNSNMSPIFQGPTIQQ